MPPLDSHSRLAWWISIILFACILLNAGSFLAGSIKSTMYVRVLCAWRSMGRRIID